jgi:SAM-dependent methyltransferase
MGVDEFQYGKCSNCGYIQKLLSVEEYRGLPVTYEPGNDAMLMPTEELRELLDIQKKRSLIRRLSARVTAKVRPQTLLDIGCGMGGYLWAAQELGIVARGIEPSETHSRIGRERLQLDITTAYFGEGSAATESYDIIIVSHVIEHIYEQRKFISTAYAALRPGGVMYMATPNANATIARVSGRYWSMLKPVDHVGLLTPQALRLITPPGSESNIWTDEYVWEPAIGVGSALRNMRRARKPSGRPDERPTGEVRNSYRSTVSTMRKMRILRAAAGASSWPIYLFDRVTARASCLVCELHKPIDGVSGRP